MTDDNRICLALTVLLLMSTASAENQDSPRIDSAVYDIRIGENRFDGFCLLTVEANSSPEEIAFYSDYDVELMDEGLRAEQGEGGMRITGLENLKTGPPMRITLRLRGRIYNHTLQLPLLSFPYQVDSTLVAVSAPGKKFLWNPAYAMYPVDDENPEKVMAGDDFREEDLPRVNSEYLRVRSATSKSLSIPEYRMYLGALEPGEKPTLSCWSGTVYDYYAWQTILAAVLSVAFLSALYLYSRKRRRSEKTEEAEPVDADLQERRREWESSLKQLVGDEYSVYKMIMEAGGEMLQKRICEETCFSSVRTTRVLDRLEQRNLLERKSYGVTNKVVLR